jgi:hypothetical protein
LEKQGSRLSPATIDFYDLHLGKFFGWLDRCFPGVQRFDDLEADALRRFRAELAGSPGRYGRPLQPESLHASHLTPTRRSGEPAVPSAATGTTGVSTTRFLS